VLSNSLNCLAIMMFVGSFYNTQFFMNSTIVLILLSLKAYLNIFGLNSRTLLNNSLSC